VQHTKLEQWPVQGVDQLLLVSPVAQKWKQNPTSRQPVGMPFPVADQIEKRLFA
jgi:hypothetical protein